MMKWIPCIIRFLWMTIIICDDAASVSSNDDDDIASSSSIQRKTMTANVNTTNTNRTKHSNDEQKLPVGTDDSRISTKSTKPTTRLSSEAEAILAQGKPYLYRSSGNTTPFQMSSLWRQEGLVIVQDIAAPMDTIWEQILDVSHYDQKVPYCIQSELYDSNHHHHHHDPPSPSDTNHPTILPSYSLPPTTTTTTLPSPTLPQTFHVRLKWQKWIRLPSWFIGRSPRIGFEWYVRYEYHPTLHTLLWTLDDDRYPSSHENYFSGYWYVIQQHIPHQPSNNTSSRLEDETTTTTTTTTSPTSSPTSSPTTTTTTTTTTITKKCRVYHSTSIHIHDWNWIPSFLITWWSKQILLGTMEAIKRESELNYASKSSSTTNTTTTTTTVSSSVSSSSSSQRQQGKPQQQRRRRRRRWFLGGIPIPIQQWTSSKQHPLGKQEADDDIHVPTTIIDDACINNHHQNQEDTMRMISTSMDSKQSLARQYHPHPHPSNSIPSKDIRPTTTNTVLNNDHHHNNDHNNDDDDDEHNDEHNDDDDDDDNVTVDVVGMTRYVLVASVIGLAMYNVHLYFSQ